MATAISKGMLVKVEVPTSGKGIPIKTTSHGPLAGDIREYYREKTSKQPGRFLFGTVFGGPYEEFNGQKPEDQKYLVQWSGERHRVSSLPTKLLIPAINWDKR